MTLPTKPEAHNVSQRISEEDGQLLPTRNENVAESRCVVPDICLGTDRQTDRHAEHNTALPCRGKRSTNIYQEAACKVE